LFVRIPGKQGKQYIWLCGKKAKYIISLLSMAIVNVGYIRPT